MSTSRQMVTNGGVIPHEQYAKGNCLVPIFPLPPEPGSASSPFSWACMVSRTQSETILFMELKNCDSLGQAELSPKSQSKIKELAVGPEERIPKGVGVMDH